MASWPRRRWLPVIFAVGVVAAGCTTATQSSSVTGTTQPSMEPGPSFRPVRGTTADLTPLAASVLAAPNPVTTTDDRVHLVYEITLINTSIVATHIESVSVEVPGSNQVLATYSGSQVTSLLSIGHVPATSPTLGPAESGMLFLDVSLPAGQAVPTSLDHRFQVSFTPPGAKEAVAQNYPGAAPTTVGQGTPLLIGPPMSGAGVVDANGCCADSPHTRAVLTIDGTSYLAQRYAIDFVRFNAQNQEVIGDTRINANYLIFGQPVIAVADATVASTGDGEPENTPPNPAANLSPKNALGNFVTLDLGQGRFATYAHLQPGSLKVQVGQKVTRGQVLGLVGNTGSSTAPHLHFQVTDGPVAIQSNGIPYTFDSFDIQGQITNLSELGDGKPAKVAPTVGSGHHQGQLPLQGAIIDFGGGPAAQ